MASFRELYPPPWTVERMPAGYRVIAANGAFLGYFYALTEHERAMTARYNHLTWAEALTLAKAVARLGER